MTRGLPLAAHRRLLRTYVVTPHKGRLALVAALVATGILLQLLNPQIIRYYIDATQSGGSLASLALAGAAFLVVGLLARAVALAAGWAGRDLAWRSTNALRADLTAHLLGLDMPFHKAHTPGELIERVDGDAGALGELFSQLTVRVAASLALIVAILALIWREDPRAGAALAVYVALVACILILLHRFGAARWAAERQAAAEQFGFVEERLGGAEDIRGVGAEAYQLDRLGALTDDFMQKARAGWMATALGFLSTHVLYAIGYGLGLALGAALYQTGQVTIGAAFVLVDYIGMLGDPLQQLREQTDNLQQATASVGRISALLAMESALAQGKGAALPTGPLEVSIEGVSFAYNDQGARDTEAPENGEVAGFALQNVSFALAPGRVLGVLGRTGSGKTSLTRLLLRLYDPTAGAVRLGGIDLRDAALSDLRQRVGMVTQDVQLFGGTLRDNITLFDPDVSEGAVLRALAEVGLDGLPGGPDAVLGSGGQGLSAGEAQLAATARILLRDPGLVILDEASSRVDPATEALMERAFDRLLAGRTAVVIAHRLGTVRRADDILILEAGRVVEHGARTALAADPGSRFAGLLRTGLEEALA
jgi:ABC-type multidrug transport system fused ATPase/permease subunit